MRLVKRLLILEALFFCLGVYSVFADTVDTVEPESINDTAGALVFQLGSIFLAVPFFSRLTKKAELSQAPGKDRQGSGGTDGDPLSCITPVCTTLSLHGTTKEEIITELVDLLAGQGRLLDRDTVLNDVLEREKIMSTGMQHSIALPHAKTDGAGVMAAAVGIKKEGIDFESVDGESTKLFILVVAPKNMSGLQARFLAAISTVLSDGTAREKVIKAASAENAAALLKMKTAES